MQSKDKGQWHRKRTGSRVAPIPLHAKAASTTPPFLMQLNIRVLRVSFLQQESASSRRFRTSRTKEQMRQVRWRPDKCFLIVERSREQADQAVETPLTSRCSAVRTKNVLCRAERKQLAFKALVVQCLPFLIKCVNTGFEWIVLDGGAIVEAKVS